MSIDFNLRHVNGHLKQLEKPFSWSRALNSFPCQINCSGDTILHISRRRRRERKYEKRLTTEQIGNYLLLRNWINFSVIFGFRCTCCGAQFHEHALSFKQNISNNNALNSYFVVDCTIVLACALRRVNIESTMKRKTPSDDRESENWKAEKIFEFLLSRYSFASDNLPTKPLKWAREHFR